MNNKVEVMQINLIKLFDKSVDRIYECTNFCYPEGKLEEGRAHPQLLKIGSIAVGVNNLIQLIKAENLANQPSSFEGESSEENAQKINNAINHPFIRYMDDVIQVIIKEKQFSYPDNKLDTGRNHTSLQRIQAAIKGYKTTKKQLMNYILENEPESTFANINIRSFLVHLDVENCYRYAYPDKHFSQTNCHPALEMLSGQNRLVHDLFDNVEQSKISIQTIDCLIGLDQTLCKLQDVIYSAYPNNRLDVSKGHNVLTKYIEGYLNFREKFESEFKLLNSLNLERVSVPSNVEEDSATKFKKLL